jgi:hypothetical protein
LQDHPQPDFSAPKSLINRMAFRMFVEDQESLSARPARVSIFGNLFRSGD